MIRLRDLLWEQLELPQDTVQRIATSMGETLGERLGSGANGVAYATTSGRVIKITQDTAEIALATRLRTKRLYKHIVNIDDVRRIANSPYHVILMDQVTPFTDAEQAQWRYIWRQFFNRKISDAQFREWCAILPSVTRDGKTLDPTFIRRCAEQRVGILRDFSELRIDWEEAHQRNMGWNSHGSLVHYDAWQYVHSSKVHPETRRVNRSNAWPNPHNRDAYAAGLGQDIKLGLEP